MQTHFFILVRFLEFTKDLQALITLKGKDIIALILLTTLDEEVSSELKEYYCIQVNHHKELPAAIADIQNLGWRLHTYQATGFGTDVKHYLLFKKGA
jgi:hypothetical protein